MISLGISVFARRFLTRIGEDRLATITSAGELEDLFRNLLEAEREIATLDFVSELEPKLAPFLVALTAQ